ncbi:MAG: DUF3575 domain-containing protein [Bacteroidales bacterium]|nr:DUF3575 domain-containing protein [Bacteroidales bacterium]
MRKTLLIAFLALICTTAGAQKVAVGTNVVDWVNLGTANIEAGLSIGQHFSAFVGGRYNPWSFDNTRQNVPMRNNALSDEEIMNVISYNEI